MKKFLTNLTLLALFFLLLGGGYLLFLRTWVDPRPWNNQTERVALTTQTFAQQTPSTIQIQSHIPPYVGQPEPFDLLLTGQFVDGEMDSGYGLWAATTAVDTPLIFWITPTGYAGITHGETWLVPLAPWPHVRPAGADVPNELWVRFEPHEDTLTMRLNRELFWVGKVVGLTGEAGTAVAIWGANPAVHIQFQQIQRSER